MRRKLHYVVVHGFATPLPLPHIHTTLKLDFWSFGRFNDCVGIYTRLGGVHDLILLVMPFASSDEKKGRTPLYDSSSPAGISTHGWMAGDGIKHCG